MAANRSFAMGAVALNDEYRRNQRYLGAEGTPWETLVQKGQQAAGEIDSDLFQSATPETLAFRLSDPCEDSDSEGEPPMECSDHKIDVPAELTIYPDTDTEGEPRVKTAAELWPVAKVDRRRLRLPTTKRSRQASKESVASQSTCTPSSRQSSKESTCSWALSATPDGSVSLVGHEVDEPEVTTLVVRNLLQSVTQLQFLEQVDCSGFAGAYDFVYLPSSSDGRDSLGNAFVNFRTPELAATFKAAWHLSIRPGMSPESVALNVVAASIQGYRANAGRWHAAWVGRAKGPEVFPFICQERSRDAAAVRHEQAGHCSSGAATTLVVRNLSEYVTQQEFLDEVNRSGFAGKYDFAYLPRSRDSGRGSGHAFVNFRTPQAASAFKTRWHRAARLNVNSRSTALSVAASSVQGFRANTIKWTSARKAQVKNPSFLPFIFRSSQSSECHEAA